MTTRGRSARISTARLIRRLRKYKTFTCGVQSFRPYPRTPVTEQLKENKLFYEPQTLLEWTHPDNIAMFTYAELDRTKAMQLGVDAQDVFAAMQIYLGSLYVNDFNRFGRTYQVIAQADRQFRSTPDDVLRLQTRNSDGRMVPLGALLRVSDTTGWLEECATTL